MRNIYLLVLNYVLVYLFMDMLFFYMWFLSGQQPVGFHLGTVTESVLRLFI